MLLQRWVRSLTLVGCICAFSRGQDSFLSGSFESANLCKWQARQDAVLGQAFRIRSCVIGKKQKNWRLTSPGSTDHIGKLPTKDLGQSRYLWFGLSIAGDDALLPLMNSTLVRFQSPESDSDRRVQAFVSALKGVEFPLITLNTEHERLGGPSFLHFAVTVGPTGFSEYEGSFRMPPLNGRLVSRPRSMHALQVPIRSYRPMESKIEKHHISKMLTQITTT